VKTNTTSKLPVPILMWKSAVYSCTLASTGSYKPQKKTTKTGYTCFFYFTNLRCCIKNCLSLSVKHTLFMQFM